MTDLSVEEKEHKRRLANIRQLHESFLVDENIIADYLESGMDYLELKKIMLCSYITKRPINEIVDMRKEFVWTRVLYLLGLTAAKFDEGEKNFKADRISRLFNIERDMVIKYQNLGFASHQIKRAYYLSTYCDKPMLEILEMKTRTKKWPDIAEELGLPREACFQKKI